MEQNIMYLSFLPLCVCIGKWPFPFTVTFDARMRSLQFSLVTFSIFTFNGRPLELTFCPCHCPLDAVFCAYKLNAQAEDWESLKKCIFCFLSIYMGSHWPERWEAKLKNMCRCLQQTWILAGYNMSSCLLR